jgi:hypothetical protein
MSPKNEEGFHRIITVVPADFEQDMPTKEEVDLILARAAQAPLVDQYTPRIASKVEVAPASPPPPRFFNSTTGAGPSWRQKAEQAKLAKKEQSPKAVEKLGIRWGNLEL